LKQCSRLSDMPSYKREATLRSVHSARFEQQCRLAIRHTRTMRRVAPYTQMFCPVTDKDKLWRVTPQSLQQAVPRVRGLGTDCISDSYSWRCRVSALTGLVKTLSTVHGSLRVSSVRHFNSVLILIQSHLDPSMYPFRIHCSISVPPWTNPILYRSASIVFPYPSFSFRAPDENDESRFH
jgi:hypothetical protein